MVAEYDWMAEESSSLHSGPKHRRCCRRRHHGSYAELWVHGRYNASAQLAAASPSNV